MEVRNVFLGTGLIMLSAASWASNIPTCEKIDKVQVERLFDKWNNSLQTETPRSCRPLPQRCCLAANCFK